MKRIPLLMTASAALLILFVLIVFTVGTTYIRRKDNQSQLNQMYQTGVLARWIFNEMSMLSDADANAYELPFEVPPIFIRQRIMIFDSRERLRSDTGWIINDTFEHRRFKPPYKGGDTTSLPQTVRGAGILDGNIIYHVQPLRNGEEIMGYVVVMSDKVLILYRWRIMKFFNLLLTFLAFVISCGLIVLFHKAVSGPVGSLTAELEKKNRSIREFADDVLHELKNPLASIRAGLEADVDTIGLIREAGRAEKLLQAIGELSMYDTADYGSYQTDPLRVIQGLELLYESRPVIFRYGANENPGGTVKLPDEELGRVFRNLIDNALSFSPVNEKVEVFIDINKSSLIARVSDRGMGVPPGEEEKIFQRFYTTGSRGRSLEEHFGLGLAIARKIVGQIRGELYYEKNKPSGAVFCLYLPLE